MTDNEKNINNAAENASNEKPDATKSEDAVKKTDKKVKKPSEKEKLKEQILELEKKYSELEDSHLRTLAEYDNFRKRTVKEKSAMFDDGVFDAVEKILPIADNAQRALSVEKSDVEDYKKGVDMIVKQISDVFGALGIEEINPLNESFDPNFHNAVMHVEDENFGEGEVVEVFQKGYKKVTKF